LTDADLSLLKVRSSTVPSVSRTVTTVIGLLVVAGIAAAILLTVVLARRDDPREQQAALTAATAQALSSNATLDHWATSTARTAAFEHPADGTSRRLYATSHTTQSRTAAVDIMLTNGRVRCLVSSASQLAATSPSTVKHSWHDQPCRIALKASNPMPTPLHPTPN
jgi:hypothetical protein